MKRLWIGSMAAVFIWMGCGGAKPNQIVSPRNVPSASGAPVIARITDLGDLGPLPSTGTLPAPDSDGVFVVGELVLIEGKDFGKQPTVNIGGRPADALARTGSGSVIARIPPGVPTGRIDVEISHPGGRGAMAMEVRRYGFVVQPGAGKVHVITVDARGRAEPFKVLDIAGARDVAISHDGQVALVAADAAKSGQGGRVAVIAIPASGGPRLIRELVLGTSSAAQVTSIECARRAGMAVAVVTDRDESRLVLFDLEDPRTPARHEPFALSDKGAGTITAVAIWPDGSRLAAVLSPQNLLVPVDIRTPATPRPGALVELVPDARVPLVRDLGLSPTADELWVLAGDHAGSLATGVHPTQLVIVSTAGDPFQVVRKVDITGAGAPMALAIASRESTRTSTAIQSRERRAAIAVATVDRSVFAQSPPDGASADLGQLMRTDLEGQADTIVTDPGIVSSVAMSHDARFLVAAFWRLTSPQGQAEFGVLITAYDGGEPSTLRLSQDAPETPWAPAPVALAP